ncbi:LysR substrate-binding domain-containing protein [Dyella sp.]|uniref:LysR substrate-binding domain-containing protein n=1 Tax=Dyella sp. TaxID=1869338 RepID=UPI002ED175E8
MRCLPPLIALRFFEQAARHLSFNQAASSLSVTQGAVSRQIKILEDALGVLLFERRHNGVGLTPAGMTLLERVAVAFDAIEQGVRAVHPHEQRTRLTLSVPPTFATQWLSPRMDELTSILPGVELSILTQPYEAAHCTIRFGRHAKPGLESSLLMLEQHVLVCSPRWANTSLETLFNTLPNLHVFDGVKRQDLWPAWLDEAGIQRHGAPLGIDFSTLEQSIHAARKGAGIALVDRNMIAEELAEGRLVCRSHVQTHGPDGYWLDIEPRHSNNRAVQAFAGWLRASFSTPEEHP